MKVWLMGFSPLVRHPNAHHPQAMTMLEWLSALQCSDAHHKAVPVPMLDQLIFATAYFQIALLSMPHIMLCCVMLCYVINMAGL